MTAHGRRERVVLLERDFDAPAPKLSPDLLDEDALPVLDRRGDCVLVHDTAVEARELQQATTSSERPRSRVLQTPHDGDPAIPTIPATSKPDRL